jgi:hypothetical protein
MLGFSAVGSEPIGSATSIVDAAASGAILTASSTIVGGAGLGQINAVASGANLVGVASIAAGSALGGAGAQDAIALGATLISSAAITPGPAAAITYARAPSGPGYTPQGTESQARPAQVGGTRPAATQRNNR